MDTSFNEIHPSEIKSLYNFYFYRSSNRRLGCNLNLFTEVEIRKFKIGGINSCCLAKYIIEEIKYYYNYNPQSYICISDVLRCYIIYDESYKDFDIIFYSVEDLNKLEIEFVFRVEI